MVETIVGEEDPEAVSFILERLSFTGFPPAARIIGFRDKQGIRGVFMFERYTGVKGSIHAHWVGRDPRWLKGYMLTLIGMYVYDQLQCQLMYAEVRGGAHSAQVVERLGFTQVACLENYFPDGDMIIYRAHKNEYRWLPDEFKEAA